MDSSTQDFSMLGSLQRYLGQLSCSLALQDSCMTTYQLGPKPRSPRNTYNIAIPQCLPALSPAAWKPERPMRATVGVMVRGPMYRNRAPGRPSKPITTSIKEDMIIAPWIWTHKKGKETAQSYLTSKPQTSLFFCSGLQTAVKRIQWHRRTQPILFVIKQLIRFKWLIA